MTSPLRTGQVEQTSREEFRERFHRRFFDPAYAAEADALKRLEEIAWQSYHEGRKAPVTVKAGPGFADPDYDLSVEWRDTQRRLAALQAQWSDPATPPRVLVI
ncbi:MAG: NADPH-dependent FMN reductase, partial [Oxalobacteraceae bacterium]